MSHLHWFKEFDWFSLWFRPRTARQSDSPVERFISKQQQKPPKLSTLRCKCSQQGNRKFIFIITCPKHHRPWLSGHFLISCFQSFLSQPDSLSAIADFTLKSCVYNSKTNYKQQEKKIKIYQHSKLWCLDRHAVSWRVRTHNAAKTWAELL